MNPEENHPSFLQKYKLTLISLFVVVLAAIPLLLLSNSASKKPSTTSMAPSLPVSPTGVPMTVQNAQPTLTTADTQIQNTMNQMDKDVQSVNQIDTTQDSTTGL